MIEDERIELELKRHTRFRRLVHRGSCASTQDLAALPDTDGLSPVKARIALMLELLRRAP